MDNAEIRKRYETYAKQQVNFSPSANAIMEKIKNGYDPNQADVFELMTNDQAKVDKYRYFYDLKQKALDTSKEFTEEEFDSLIDLMGLKDETLISRLKDKYRGIGRLAQKDDEKAR